MTDIVGHFLVFSVVSVVGLMVPLLLGALVRPTGAPSQEKDAVYECGEPTIGSSYVQFDLRFYVVALLFIIFDVELVFFFPWVLAFGGATQLADTRLTDVERTTLSERLLSVEPGTLDVAHSVSADAALRMSWTALFDVLFFFAVLLVGFAYVWKRGDLNWVRAVTQKSKFSRPARHAPVASGTASPVIAG
ncbi:MAG: NADH-quinone oxidoreductase subunit A [Planctomycetales bacterium 12-60-4]|nr:MAG: NADH-quinone oxidoreductase subunit A [Planctomycetales bacterium 12-60-4]